VRPVTRNTVLGILLVVVALLALGAVPSLLRSGEPYYVTATAVEAPDTEPVLDVANLSERRYPYVTGAVASAAAAGNTTGRSEPYYDGPLGVKEGFAHSPNDEFDAIGQRYGNVTVDAAFLATRNGTAYRLEIVREGSA
jgi:hypothetical protein